MTLFALQPHRIVIAGAGYGGLHAACGIARRFDPDRVRLTIIQPGSRFTDVCRLHEMSVRPVSISYDLAAALVRFPLQWIDGQVQEIDADSQIATVDSYGHPVSVPYDTLIVATGSVSSDYGIPGVKEYALPLKSPDHAERIRAKLDSLRRRKPPARILIAGGGLTGVELAAEIADEWNLTPGIRQPELVLLDAADRLLPASGKRAAEYAARYLLSRGIKIRLRTSIAGVYSSGIALNTGERLAADAVIWCAGVRPLPLPGLEALYTGPGGRIPVNGFLESGQAGIYAIGDQAAVNGPDGGLLPPRAMYACQMGDQAAAIIMARFSGKPAHPFRPENSGELTSLGHRDGVGYVYAGGRKMLVTGRSAAVMKSVSLQVHLVQLMVRVREPILPEGALLSEAVSRLWRLRKKS
ncbi:MAG: FAD-dependent oxidoreductase [Deltaproteobacteria bacterium]|nr:FAD-dependent oxidoreductase [Deltaproteobacteria bacterium]